MICPSCGAVFPDGGKCWNCTPARVARPEDLPEAPVDPVHEELMRRYHGKN